jgi:hypothetical protein
MASMKLPRLCGVLALLALSITAAAFPTRPIDEGELRARSGEAPLPEVLLDADGASKLFGGRAAKLVILHAGPHWAGTSGHQAALWLVDFSRDPIEPVLVRTDAHTWIGDPSISPDGTRVVYHDGRDIYVCRLEEGGGGATRIGPGYDPRWWVHPQTGDEYIIYVSTRWENSANVRGETYIQRIERGETRPSGGRDTLVHGFALRGGRSRDGRYMSTAQPGWLWVELHPTRTSDAFVAVIDRRSGGHCNVSTSQDPTHPNRFLWLDGPHRRLFYDPVTNASIPPLAPYREFTYTEWSTHADYLTASFYGAGIREFQPQRHIVGVYDWSREAWTPVARGAATHHLWVEETPADTAAYAAAPSQRPPGREPSAGLAERTWPVNPDGLVFLWTNANEPAEGPGAVDLAMEGRVRYTRAGAMQLEGGAFRLNGMAEVLREAVLGAGQFSVLLRVRPEGPPDAGERAFFTLGPGPASLAPNGGVILSQVGQDLLATSQRVRWSLMWGDSLQSQRPTHVALTLARDHRRLHARGGAVGSRISPARELRLHPDEVVFGSPEWRGAIEGVAMFARELSTAEVEANARAHRRRPSIPSPVTVSAVTARVRQAPVLPDPSQSAYKRAWAAFEYDIEQVHSGDVPLGRILVARYVWMDGEILPAATAEPGDRHELLLEPYEANSQIHSERQFHLDDVDLDTPMFYDVGPLTED